MAKFKNWVDKNSGFITFYGFIFMVLAWILAQLKIELSPSFWKTGIAVLAYKINIPIFMLVIFLILLFILFYSKLGNWNKLFFKSIQKKIIEIISDSSTIFEGSPTYPKLSKHQNSYVYKDGGYWNSFKQFSELSTSYWISHKQMISDEEAIKGGTYQFLKEFNIDFNFNRIEEAILFFSVDNQCSITINDKLIGTYSGYDNLTKIDIKDNLLKGKNKIIFEVFNYASEELGTPKWASSVNKKGSINPYGIKYNLRIVTK